MNTILIFITLASFLLSVATSIVAWRAVSGERRRSQARIAALSAEIGDDGWPPFQPVSRLQSAEMFALEQGTKERSRVPIVIMTGVVIVGAIVILAMSVPIRGSRGSQGSPGSQGSIGSQGSQGSVGSVGSQGSQGSQGSGSSGSGAIAGREGAPIELLALGHERTADRLTIHGVVRNPANGLDVAHLTAVVLLFNGAGVVVTTGRAAIDASDLMPGAEAPFTVSVAAAVNAGRYRVSFRTDDDHIVPHVDKRDGA